MPLTGYLKIDDIPGESQRVDHEDEIDVHDIAWGVTRTTTAQVGRGRARARSDVSPLLIRKFYDRASPYLAQSAQRGKSFDEVVLSVRKDSGEAHLDYLVITMTNVVISSYGLSSNEDGVPDGLIGETCEFDFEKVTIQYTVQADDHSAGEVHEVELRVT